MEGREKKKPFKSSSPKRFLQLLGQSLHGLLPLWGFCEDRFHGLAQALRSLLLGCWGPRGLGFSFGKGFFGFKKLNSQTNGFVFTFFVSRGVLLGVQKANYIHSQAKYVGFWMVFRLGCSLQFSILPRRFPFWFSFIAVRFSLGKPPPIHCRCLVELAQHLSSHLRHRLQLLNHLKDSGTWPSTPPRNTIKPF